MKHTPGPWRVEVGDDTTSVESKYFTIASDVSNEDAALIAAAPDLLAACEAALMLVAYETGEDPDVDNMIRNAIRKAKNDRTAC